VFPQEIKQPPTIEAIINKQSTNLFAFIAFKRLIVGARNSAGKYNISS